MSFRTLAIVVAALGLLGGIGLSGCDSGTSPTVRQRTLAVGEPSSPPASGKTEDLPAGHPKVSRPPRPPADSPFGQAIAEGPKPEDGQASAGDARATASDEPPDREPEKSAHAPLAAVAKGGAEAAQNAAPQGQAASLSAIGRDAAPQPAEDSKAKPQSTEPESRRVQIGNLRLEAPRGWLRKKPPIDFILAEFVLPRAPGDPEDAQLTVTAVGPNSARRLNQLREELKKSPGQATVEHLTISGVEVILVDATASYGEMPGVFAPEIRQGRYRVLNAILPVGEKLYFVNCSGPEKTVGHYAKQFRDFLLGMKAADAP